MNKVIFSFVLLIMVFGLWLYFGQSSQTATIVVEITHETVGNTSFPVEGSPLAGKVVQLERVDGSERLWLLTDKDGLAIFANLSIPSKWNILVWEGEQRRLLLTYSMGRGMGKYEHVIVVDKGGVVVNTFLSDKIKR